MREIRQSGSEGGGTGTTGPPYPYFLGQPSPRGWHFGTARAGGPRAASRGMRIAGRASSRRFTVRRQLDLRVDDN
jgi:hypothetical protein